MKRRLGTVVLATMMVTNMSISAFATSPVSTQDQEKTVEMVSPKKDVYVYYYREYKGMLQERKWNETQGYWVGDWVTIAVAN